MTVGLPFPQAPSEAEAAADLIDMGADPAASGALSSQLAGMSKCGYPCSSGGAILCYSWSWRPNSRVLAQTPPHWGPRLNLATRLSIWDKTWDSPSQPAMPEPSRASEGPLF